MVPCFVNPSERQLQAFLARESQRPFSYPEVGQSNAGAPPGYDLDHNRVELGRGPAAFEAACQALTAWRQFPAPWTRIYPANAPLAPGTTVAMLAHVFGLWWFNSCRIVYTIDDSPVLQPKGTTPVLRPNNTTTPVLRPNNTVQRFGFAYGTLPAHVERGEERFLIEMDADGVVWYDLRAFSRPRLWLLRLGYPLARAQQRRFVRDSQQALRAAVPTYKHGQNIGSK